MRVRDLGREEGALPAGPVVEHQAAQVQPGDQAERERCRRGVQQQLGAPCRQAAAAFQPQRREAMQRRGAAAGGQPRQADAPPDALGDAAHDRPAMVAVATAELHQRPDHEAEVDEAVPDEHAPHRRRQQVDLVRAGQAVGQQADDEGKDRGPDRPAQPPATTARAGAPASARAVPAVAAHAGHARRRSPRAALRRARRRARPGRPRRGRRRSSSARAAAPSRRPRARSRRGRCVRPSPRRGRQARARAISIFCTSDVPS